MVITGMGTVNPLGNDVASSWNAALTGVSGIALIESFPTAEQPVKFAGQLKGSDPESVLEPKESRRGRPRRYFEIRPKGLGALEQTTRIRATMWQGIDLNSLGAVEIAE